MRPFFAALAAMLLAVPAASAPKIIGKTQTDVRVLKTGTRDTVATKTSGGTFDLESPAPAGASPGAVALAKRIIQGFGGRAGLTAWLERGERHGRQAVFAPAHLSASFVE